MRVSPVLRSLYPRIHASSNALTHTQYIERYKSTPEGQKDTQNVTLRGRLSSKRSAGQHLHFLDIISEHTKLQAVAENCTDELRAAIAGLSIGDHIEVSGIPGRHERGELSIYANKIIPLSHCHHRIPQKYTDLEKRLRNRHVDFIVNSNSAQTIRTRSKIISTLRSYFAQHGFIEIETPILQGSASGAVARPFRTTTITDRQLQLRIAPELALKRAVIGGFDRVFEIGKCFRNEGLSRFHNPEFTTCEYYQAYAGLNDLIESTKELLRAVESSVGESKLFQEFKIIDFLPELEKHLGVLPDTQEGLLDLTRRQNIKVTDTSLAGLYDTLASKYLEPQCIVPTFIINHPQVLSPLAKSSNGISHRFELIVNGMELINAYEEENDPSVQRANFSRHGALTPDEEDYCSALEWGLPPTGGWGVGIDRLCMLLTNTQRINEVLIASGIQYQR